MFSSSSQLHSGMSSQLMLTPLPQRPGMHALSPPREPRASTPPVRLSVSQQGLRNSSNSLSILALVASEMMDPMDCEDVDDSPREHPLVPAPGTTLINASPALLPPELDVIEDVLFLSGQLARVDREPVPSYEVGEYVLARRGMDEHFVFASAQHSNVQVLGTNRKPFIWALARVCFYGQHQGLLVVDFCPDSPELVVPNATRPSENDHIRYYRLSDAASRASVIPLKSISTSELPSFLYAITCPLNIIPRRYLLTPLTADTIRRIQRPA